MARVLYVMTEGFTPFRLHTEGLRQWYGLEEGWTPPNLYYRRDSWRLPAAEEFQQAQFETWLRGGPVQVLALDTLNRTLPIGWDENDNTQLGQYVDAWKLFGNLHEEMYPDDPRPAIWFAHHTPKAGHGPRGAGAIEGNTDVTIDVEKHRADDGSVLCSEVRNDRLKGYEEFHNFLFSMEWQDTGETWPHGEPKRRPVIDKVEWRTSFDASRKKMTKASLADKLVAYLQINPGAYRAELEEKFGVGDRTIRNVVEADDRLWTETEGRAYTYWSRT